MNSHVCKRCLVNVDPSLSHCPLCGRFLNDVNPIIKETLYPNTDFKRLEKKLSTRLQVFFAFPLLLALFTTIMIDLFLISQNFGSTFIVTGAVIYAWILIYQSILSDNSLGAKILWQLIGLSILFLIIGFTVEQTLITWPLLYVIPILMSVTNLIFFSIVTFFHRHDMMLIQMFFAALLSLIPYALFLSLGFQEGVPSLIATLTGVMNIMSILTFYRYAFKTYLVRWLHL
jgi:hypothetical protein